LTDSGVQDRRTSSRGWSEDILTARGFRRLRNTSLFENRDGVLVLSPGVGPGGNGRYWFDLRDANLQKATRTGTQVFLRIVDHGFVLLPLDGFRKHLNDRTRRLTKAGPAYGFNCFFDGGTVTLKSSSDATYSFTAALLDRADATVALARS
jgi:hypothetical protein